MLAAFIIGLFSTIHCIGMCGGLVGAMMMSLDPQIRLQPSRLVLFTFAYNSGRIFSYAVAGLLIGWFGEALSDTIMPENGIEIFRFIASLMIVAMGLYIAGWFPQFARIEKLGMPIWKFLQPLGQRLLPVSNLVQAFLFGTIWGWLPCGLVYYMLLMSPAADGAVNSSLFMLVFGLGTLIPLMVTGFLSGRMSLFRNSKKIRYMSGITLIILGIINIWLVLDSGVRHQLHFHII
jgi:hypothetical protein